jgi:polysaccharide biosynthesis protein PslG
MRRAVTALVTSALVLAGAAASAPAQAAPAGQGGPVPLTQFGLHVPQIANGAVPTVTYGSVRLWDSGVAWGQVQQKKNTYWWNGLDAAIASANAQNAKIMYVLGSTPKWAASNTKQGTYPNKGAASMPSMKDWKNWVKAVSSRYADSIESYQIWNEANLQTFWQGTPKQMAQLTNEARKIIRKTDPTATVVAASSTVRLQSAYKKFFPAYLKELKKLNWPIDVVSVHLYPASTGTPGDRAAYITQVKSDMKKAKVPASKPLWDTEINYGIAGPGSGNPDKDIEGATAAAWTAQTYLDDLRLGVGRAYWYFWAPNANLVGIQMQPGTPGAIGYQTVSDWLNGSYYSCTTDTVNTCQLGDYANPQVIAWASKGSGTFTVPANVTRVCDALRQCAPATPGTQVTIGSMPQWFGTATAFS